MPSNCGEDAKTLDLTRCQDNKKNRKGIYQGRLISAWALEPQQADIFEFHVRAFAFLLRDDVWLA